MFSICAAIEKAGAGNHPPHPNKRTPSPTHQERLVCDVSLPGGLSPVFLQHNIYNFVLLHQTVFNPFLLEVALFSSVNAH